MRCQNQSEGPRFKPDRITFGGQCINEAEMGCYCKSCYEKVCSKTPEEARAEQESEWRYQMDIAEAEFGCEPGG